MMKYLIRAGVLFWLPVAVSCGGRGRAVPDTAMNQYIAATKAAGRVVELISTVTPTLKDDFRPGDQVPISYTLTADTVALDSAVLYIRGERVGRISGQWSYRADPDHPLGRVPYRITAYQGKDSTVRVGEFMLKAAAAPVRYGYRVVHTYPHDKKAYTQGLYWHNGHLYESTGQTGQSTLRQVELMTGNVLKKKDLEEKYFGEGAAYLNGKIYQLTWQHNKGFIYDPATFRQIGEFGYAGEGWGLTTDGEYLYMSTDGSEKILVLDPETFRTIRTIQVYTDEGKVSNINELEWIEGEIWANVYMTEAILRIDPVTGAVKGIIDMRKLLSSSDKDIYTDVLNGIAYDPDTKRVFVTGKNWPKLFEIEVVKRE